MAKTRRKEVETVRTYRSEDIPTIENEPSFWSRMWPWSRGRARYGFQIPEVDVNVPDTKLRERLSNVRMPDVRLPEVNLRDVKLPDVDVRDLNLRDVKLPDLKLGERLADVRDRLADRSSDARETAERQRRFWQQRSEETLDAARGRRRGFGLTTIALAALGGWAVAYFFDPDRGKSRRAQAADQLAALGRRTSEQASRTARYLSSTANAQAQAWMRSRDEYVAPNDAALSAKVESELFRDPSIDKGRLNINVENGVVVLRGTAESEDQIARIVGAVRNIDGVRTVRDLLRVPGQATSDVMGATTESSAGETFGNDQGVESTPGY
jgi:hypothetical protein